jgi:hypothetical protein
MNSIGTKRQVVNGTAEKTTGGLTKKDIKVVTKNGQRKYVSKTKHENGKRNLWIESCNRARKILGLEHEFVLLKKSSELYKVAREYYDQI